MGKIQQMNSVASTLGRNCGEMGDMRIYPVTKQYNAELGPKLIGIGTAVGAVILLFSTFCQLFCKPVGKEMKERRYNNRNCGY